MHGGQRASEEHLSTEKKQGGLSAGPRAKYDAEATKHERELSEKNRCKCEEKRKVPRNAAALAKPMEMHKKLAKTLECSTENRNRFLEGSRA